MANIANSKLLDALIEHSKKLNSGSDTPFTAERFIVALIDALEGNFDINTSENLDGAATLLKKENLNISALKKEITESIVSGKNDSYLDALYMQRKLYEARARAEKERMVVLTPEVLLGCILDEPNDNIGKCLKNNILEDTVDKIIEDLSQVKDEAKEEDKKKSGLASDIDRIYSDLFGKKKESGAATSHISLSGISFGEKKTEEKTEEKASLASVVTPPVSAKSKVEEMTAKTRDIHSKLSSIVLGQDNAVSVFSSGYFQAELLSMTDKKRVRPKATFLFAGPPGVGKTFLAETAAGILGLPFMRFDMSEYSNKEANFEFAGTDKVYKDSKAGNVTSFVEENPQCVLLFDEIEKAHINVIHLFLQLLDAGRLRDNFTDREVSFKDAIIIFTTNAGKQLYEDSESGDLSGVTRKVILKALQKDVNPETGAPFFPAAICSRFASGNVVMFNHITANNLREIAKKEVLRHAKNYEDEIGVKVVIDDEVFTALLFAEGGAADARTVRARAESFFDSELFELFRMTSSHKAQTGIGDIDEIRISVDVEGATPEIKVLFEASEAPSVLVFSDSDVARKCSEMGGNCKYIHCADLGEANSVFADNDIKVILLDINYGTKGDPAKYLNIEDIESKARDFFRYIREYHKNIPVYLLQTEGHSFDEEEKVSYMRQGVRGVLSLCGDSFAAELDKICADLHQQANMINLAKANKLVAFETAQLLSDDGKIAEIKLFDFSFTVAVDAEDSKNILSNVSKPNVKFDQVIGAEDAKKELQYFVNYLRNPKKFLGTGVRPPKGVLLYGPPGTGKTMLAKAMASESDVTFIAAEGNQFLKKHWGEGPESVHELFRTARKYAPSIIFIDEIDAIAKERTGGDGSRQNEEVLTAFLTEMDGFKNDVTKPVFVLAATNFDVEPGGAKSLDPALMRRFDRRVFIDLPTRDDRVRYMKMKIASNKAFDISEEKIENLAIRSTGMSLAQLESVFELALRSAIREGDAKVSDDVLDEAFELFNSGEKKQWDASLLKRVARHEAGHAFLYWYNGETPSYLTIVARANHGGYMQHGDTEGKVLSTRDELLARIRVSLAGRAAEIVYYGENDGISTGASGDLSSATATAEYMLCYYGMDREFGMAVIDRNSKAYSDIAMDVRRAVNEILDRELENAVRIIEENKDKIDRIVEELMIKNHMTGDEIKACVEDN